MIFMPLTIKIRRHEVINGNANPYDTEWQNYYEGRISRSLASKRPEKLKRIWINQRKRCWKCKKAIENFREGVIQLIEGNIALEEKILATKSKLIHKECHAGLRKKS